MPRSMTGFGSAESTIRGEQVCVEVRSVNHRHLNLALKLPPELSALEPPLRDALRREFDRGHVTVSIRWAGCRATNGAPQLDVVEAREAMARLRELQVAVGLSGEITLDLLARQPGVFRTPGEIPELIGWDDLAPVVHEAVTACQSTRCREGAALCAELHLLLKAIGDGRRRVEDLAPARVVRERDRLRAAVAALLDGQVLDEARLAQEIALLADRLDIREELVRLQTHLDAAAALLGEDRPVGKELGFLAQEIGREVNTIGSKANDAEIAQRVIAMKGELERFREQIENVE